MGWRLNDGEEVVFLPGEIINCPQADTKLYAEWKLNSYKLKIRLEAGEVLYKEGVKVAARNEGVYEYEIEFEFGKEFDASDYTIGRDVDNYEFLYFTTINGEQFTTSVTWSYDYNVVIVAKASWNHPSGENDKWTNIH